MRGQDELIRKLRALGSVGTELVTEVHETANSIVIDSFRDFPDHAEIRGSSRVKDTSGLGIQITSVATDRGLTEKINVNGGKLAAYVEFGTGQSAAAIVPTLPQGLQNLARTFFINGQGRIIAKPYFYPNWAKHTVGFKDRLKVIMNKAVNR